MNVVFTIAAKNYFGAAKLLAKSVKKHNPDCNMYIVLADEPNQKLAEESYFTLITAKETGIKDYAQMAFKYDITEFATAVKPFCIDYFFRVCNSENVIYLDPDIYVYESLSYIFELLKQKSAVLTPHILTHGNCSSDIENGLLQTGTYNLGFIGVSNGTQGKALVKWWAEKLKDYAYNDAHKGYYTDQKWMNLAVTEFEHIYILRDYAYNAAWWNFAEREISSQNGKPFVTQNGVKKPVVFFHFSGFKPGKADTVSKSPSYLKLKNREDIEEIFRWYGRQLNDTGYKNYISLPYAYAGFSNGIAVTRLQRRLFGKLLREGYVCSNPFDTYGESYFSLLKRNKLILNTRDNAVAACSRTDISGFEKKEKILKRLLRMIKKIIGIRRYELLSRYLSNSMDEDAQMFLIER